MSRHDTRESGRRPSAAHVSPAGLPLGSGAAGGDPGRRPACSPLACCPMWMARRDSSTRGKQIHHPLIGGEKRCAQSPATNPNWGLFGLRVTLCRRGPTELGSADRLRWAWCSYCLGEFRQADSSFDFAKSSAGGSWSSKCHSRWVAAYLAQRNKGRFDSKQGKV
jgi:hypothetical protein